MIFQLRILGLVIELLWVNGLLFGFSLWSPIVKAVGINIGPLVFCCYLDPRRVCERCGRSLGWGLHGTLGRISLCGPSQGNQAVQGADAGTPGAQEAAIAGAIAAGEGRGDRGEQAL